MGKSCYVLFTPVCVCVRKGCSKGTTFIFKNISLSFLQFGEFFSCGEMFIVFPGINESLQNLCENADTKRGLLISLTFLIM